MSSSDWALGSFGLLIFAFLGWWFWIICAIVARRVRYVVWAFWWVALMWWFVVATDPTQRDPDFARVTLTLWALALLVWPIRELYKRYYLAE